jgi:hypothetical protein
MTDPHPVCHHRASVAPELARDVSLVGESEVCIGQERCDGGPYIRARRSVIQLVVSDSSCLIDLRKGGLLSTTLLLPFRLVVALPLVAAELHGFTQADWEDLKVRGLDIVDLDAKQVRRAFELKATHAALSRRLRDTRDSTYPAPATSSSPRG